MLQARAYVFTIVRPSCDFLLRALSDWLWLIVCKLCSHGAISAASHKKSHGYHTAPVQLPYRIHMEIVCWLCKICVVLGISVPNMYNFSKGRKAMRSKKVKDPQSQGGCMFMVWSTWGCHIMTAHIYWHCMGTVWLLVMAVRLPYDYFKSLRSSCNFLVQNDHLKSYNLHMISMRKSMLCPYGTVRCIYKVSKGYR